MRLPFPAAVVALLVLAGGAAAAPDPLLDRIVAGARAVPASAIGFERSVNTVAKENAGAPESHARIERWDGRQLVLVSVDGRPATPDEVTKARDTAAGKPVAGYHRLADFLKQGAVRVADPQGRTIYRVTGLPKGSVNVGQDISASLVADALVETGGAEPYVSRLRVSLPKPLSFFMIAKLDSFEIVNDYKIGADGRPVLVHQRQSLSGAQFGKAGTTRTETSYTPLR